MGAKHARYAGHVQNTDCAGRGAAARQIAAANAACSGISKLRAWGSQYQGAVNIKRQSDQFHGNFYLMCMGQLQQDRYAEQQMQTWCGSGGPMLRKHDHSPSLSARRLVRAQTRQWPKGS
jgi:hypothetical protein